MGRGGGWLGFRGQSVWVRGHNWGPWTEATEETVQFSRSVWAANWLAVFYIEPVISLIPVHTTLVFGLQLPPVGLLGFPQPWLQIMSYPPHFLLVCQPEGLLLLVEKTFQVTSGAGPVVWEAANSLSWQGAVFTKCDVFCDAVSHAVNVLSMWITKHFPVDSKQSCRAYWAFWSELFSWMQATSKQEKQALVSGEPGCDQIC